MVEVTSRMFCSLSSSSVSLKECHDELTWAFSINRLPATFKMSPVNQSLLTASRVRGRHSRTIITQRLSFLRAIWPTHCHFNLPILRVMFVVLVLLRLPRFGFDHVVSFCLDNMMKLHKLTKTWPSFRVGSYYKTGRPEKLPFPYP